jgi:mRNA-degrading endonuclease RelE of RelBE toxin-antitoxin system
MYELRLTTNAENDLRALDASFRASVIAAMRTYLTLEPTKTSKSRIKRLRELRLPQYRLRVETIRVYYDVGEDYVMVYGIVPKAASYEWLDENGIPYDHSPTEPS